MEKSRIFAVRILTLAAFILGCAGIAVAGDIDPGLRDILSAKPDIENVSVLVFLSDRVDVNSLAQDLDRQTAPLSQRRSAVISALQDKAAATQGEITEHLQDLRVLRRIDEFQMFWIINAFRLDAPKAIIEAVAARPEVARVYYNYEIESIVPVDVTAAGQEVSAAVENGVQAVRAPEVWAMGLTGAGILVSNIDTGVEGEHPALASRWAGVADPRYAGHPEWAWYDPYLGNNDFPYDYNGHGTHTMGSICGGAPGDEIGVAPGANWIAAGAIDRGGGIERTVADAILSFQWMLNPDGDPGTTWDIPHVCSNSWGVTTSHGYPPCDELFWSYIDACEAAGTVVVFAAGNEGTSGLRRPADRATDEYRNMAVAAVDANTVGWPIAYFSSRGPTYCTPDGTAAIKPDIAAPGYSVRSAYPGQTYVYMSGTSMATPHVAGVVALMREANPNLGVDQIKQIIYETAYDLGPAGEDNSYGYGMIDAYEAVMLAIGDTLGPTADFTASPTSGCVPLAVNFTDLSTGDITSWAWDFGDNGTSTEQNPTHVYNAAGIYTVELTVTGPEGSDTETKVDYITVYEPPVADFVGSPTTGDAPLTVAFTDLSTGNPTGWSWDFGDGGTSALQNPAYTYDTAGVYTVSLTASNVCGSDDEVKLDYIDVTEPVEYKMHVSGIIVDRMLAQAAAAMKWYGQAEVTVVTQGGQPLSGVTVTGFFNAPQTKELTAVTGLDGVAILQSKTTPRPPDDWCFEVTNLTHDTYIYDPAANVVTRACESGIVFNARLIAGRPLPERFMLDQNHPNPFNPVTSIGFALPHPAHVNLTIFNIAGQKIATLVDDRLEAGHYTVDWNAADVASGIYLYHLRTATFQESKKMVLLK